MAKPIFIVRLAAFASDAAILSKSLQEKFYDYHVLIVQETNLETAEFEVFYEKDFNEVKFEELKEIVRSYAQNNSQNKSDNHE